MLPDEAAFNDRFGPQLEPVMPLASTKCSFLQRLAAGRHVPFGKAPASPKFGFFCFFFNYGLNPDLFLIIYL